MTTYLLIRHALTQTAGKVVTGRSPGIHLSSEGLEDAELLAACLDDFALSAIYSSPLERAQETARAIARRRGLQIITRDDLNEVAFGAWTGLTFDDLAPAAEWHRFNTLRSVTPAPGGEWMLDIQLRTVRLMEELRRKHQREVVALVTHGDVIRFALLHYLGIPIDFFHRLEVEPASVSTIELGDSSVRVLAVNERRWACSRNQHAILERSGAERE